MKKLIYCFFENMLVKPIGDKISKYGLLICTILFFGQLVLRAYLKA